MTSWSRKTIAAAAIAAMVFPPPTFGQSHKVTKPESVVRAVGVYEWTGDLTKPSGSRFVPVTVFIDGEIQDAGVYLPRPVPFALLTGNVYELEDAGLSKGTVVLEQAMKTTTPDGAAARAFTEGWTAFGTYRPPAAPRKVAATPLRASKNLPVIQSSGGDSSRPHLTNKTGDTSKPDSTQNTQNQTDSTKPPDTATTTSTDESRPTMRRRTDPPPPKVNDETDPPQDPNAAASMPKDDDDDRAERPTLKRQVPDEIAKDQKEKKKEKEAASVTAAGSMSGDPDRPTLKHGTKHVEDDEVAKLNGVPADMRQMVAVSDAKTREPHVFARPWEDTAERTAILAKMEGFARAKLGAYGTIPGIDPPQMQVASTSSGTSAASAGTTSNPAAGTQPGPPTLKRGIPTDDTTEKPAFSTMATKSASASATGASTDPAPPKLKRGVPTDDTTKPAPASHTATHTAAATSSASKTTSAHITAKSKKAAMKTPPIELAGEDLRGYLLSYGGAPTFIYMAHTVEQPGNVTRYVTIVAQDDGMGQLKVALASATDAAHLDRTPWMRLVDAVDVEASNRASLLFELRGSSSRQFVVYRVIAAKPEQIFATSGGE